MRNPTSIAKMPTVKPYMLAAIALIVLRAAVDAPTAAAVVDADTDAAGVAVVVDLVVVATVVAEIAAPATTKSPATQRAARARQ